MVDSPEAVLLYVPLMKDLGMTWKEIKETPRMELEGLLAASHEYELLHSMDGYEGKDISDMAKASIFGHEARHATLHGDSDLWGTQPKWVQKVEEPGTSEQEQFGKQYLSGHELYNRFLDERYFPREPSRPKTIDEPYFDKILSDLWKPSAKEYERVLEAKDLGERYAKGGLAYMLGE